MQTISSACRVVRLCCLNGDFVMKLTAGLRSSTELDLGGFACLGTNSFQSCVKLDLGRPSLL